MMMIRMMVMVGHASLHTTFYYIGRSSICEEMASKKKLKVFE
jgi:hypothetical protein